MKRELKPQCGDLERPEDSSIRRAIPTIVTERTAGLNDVALSQMAPSVPLLVAVRNHPAGESIRRC